MPSRGRVARSVLAGGSGGGVAIVTDLGASRSRFEYTRGFQDKSSGICGQMRTRPIADYFSTGVK